MIRRPVAAAAVALVLVVLGGCSDPAPSVPVSPSSSVPVRPATAAATAVEAFRLLVAEKEPNYQARACAYFTPDAYYIGDIETKSTTPMSKWCGDNPVDLPPATGEENQTPIAREELLRDSDSERWVRVELQWPRVAVLVKTGDGWSIRRWCDSSAQKTWGEPGDDPFRCLRVTE